MKICWDNIEDIYIPKRPHAKCDFRSKKAKYIYNESCKECGYPFLSQPQAKAEFCDRACKARFENKINKWKHGYQNYHREAYNLFGKNKCERCGCEEDQNERFSMHNTVNDHSIMEQYAWKCLCRSCHSKLHRKEHVKC